MPQQMINRIGDNQDDANDPKQSYAKNHFELTCWLKICDCSTTFEPLGKVEMSTLAKEGPETLKDTDY